MLLLKHVYYSGNGSHDNDLMTPPDVLLKQALKWTKQLIAVSGIVLQAEGAPAHVHTLSISITGSGCGQ